jgi:uncharacterized damage-inducible protein DinB
VLHALELAAEDLRRWCGDLNDAELIARPGGLAPVAFHLRHIAGSLDRLLTYAEGENLSESQLVALKTELDEQAGAAAMWAEFDRALVRSAERIRAISVGEYEQPRSVGRSALPTTVGGLMVHIADHTQRHVGQAVATAKLMKTQTVTTPK